MYSNLGFFDLFVSASSNCLVFLIGVALYVAFSSAGGVSSKIFYLALISRLLNHLLLHFVKF